MLPSATITPGYDVTTHKQSQFSAWLIVLTASLFFFYEFIQMNMLDAISQDLMASLHVNASQLGNMSAYYFLANVIFLFIAGTLLDRCSTRRVILASLGICVLGTILFGLATSLFWITVCRFLTGIGSAFCFLSVLRLASRWFTPCKMARVTGVIVTIAMVGGMVSQTPFEALVKQIGWRHTLFMDALFGVVILALNALVIRNYPSSGQQQFEHEQQQLSQIGYWQSLRIAFLRRQNWLGGIYTSTMNLPINVLGGLWGMMYLTTSYHFTKLDASYITSMLFAGTIFGSPLAGWLSDKLARRKPPMIIGAIVSLGLIGFVLWSPALNFQLLMILFFAIGFFSSTQIIGYPLVAESSQRIVTAMSVSVVNLSTVGGIGLIQSLYGYCLQSHATARVHHATTVYNATDFRWAMLIFLVGYLIALLASVAVKETYCIQQED